MEQFWQWWQHLPARIDPVLLQIGPVRLQYYGLMYLAAFGLTYYLVIRRVKTEKHWTATTEQVQSLMTALILGVLIGGRLGYVIFYNPGYYLRHPLEIVLPFRFSNGVTFSGISGMSYHGGLLGVIIAAWPALRSQKGLFLQMMDLVVPAAPLGYTFGRIGNFINGELYGRVTTKPWGMFFPLAADNRLRHPSQLYEAFFEGLFLFALLWFVKNRIKAPGAILGAYLIGYGVVRFFIEFFRQPDDHLGLVFASLSMGQILCLAMILMGLIWWRTMIYLLPNSKMKRSQ